MGKPSALEGPVAFWNGGFLSGMILGSDKLITPREYTLGGWIPFGNYTVWNGGVCSGIVHGNGGLQKEAGL